MKQTIDYRVQILDVKDDEGLPVTVTMTVDKEHQEGFEDFLRKEVNMIFGHVCGGNLEL